MEVLRMYTMELLQQIVELTTPHMKAVNDAVTEAFPDQNPDAMYTVALGFHLGSLIRALDPDEVPRAVDLLNSLLIQVNYRIVSEQ
jgi:hypothetical protein